MIGMMMIESAGESSDHEKSEMHDLLFCPKGTAAEDQRFIVIVVVVVVELYSLTC